MTHKAFLVGTNTLRLQYCQNDVDTLAKALNKHEYETIVPSNFAIESIFAQFYREFIDTCQQTDTLILYFSGHGLVEQGNLHFLLADDTSKRSNLINVNGLIGVLAVAKASSKLVILDCCHAAAATADWQPDISDRYFILTASDRVEKAKEIEAFKSSFLTYKICEFLNAPPQEHVRETGDILLEDIYDWLKLEATKYNSSAKTQVPIPNLLGNRKSYFAIGKVSGSERTEIRKTYFDSKPLRKYSLPRREHRRLVGRDLEIKRLEAWLTAHETWLMLVKGIGGIGKTALILEAFYENEAALSAHFDSAIYVSAKARSLTIHGVNERNRPIHNLDDFYKTILVVLGKETIGENVSDEQRGEFIKRELSNQRTLLILDSFETVEDPAVISFLQELPSPTKCIVSSRKRLDVLPSRQDFLQLDQLQEEDAKILIDQTSKSNSLSLSDRQTELLYERVEGVPLAIVWGIEQTKHLRDFAIVLHKLEEPANALARYILEESFQSIRNAPSYSILTLLSLFPQSVPDSALRNMAGLAEDDYAKSIDELEALSLISVIDGRHSSLKITKRHLTSGLNAAHVYQLEATVLKHYTSLADDYTANFWKLERDNVIKFIEEQLRTDSIELVQLALQLVKSYIGKIERSHFLDDVLDISDIAIKLSRKLGDLIQQIDFLLDYYETVHFLRKEFSKAEELNQEALSLSKQAGYSKGKAKAYRNLGGLAKAQNRFPEAVVLLTKALENLDETQEPEIRRVKGLLSSAYRKLDNFEGARQLLYEEIECCKEGGDAELPNLSIALCRLGTSYLEEEKPLEAIPYYEESKRIDETTRPTRVLSITFNLYKIARCYNMIGDRSLAKEYCKQALESARRIRDQSLLDEITEFSHILSDPEIQSQPLLE